MFTVTRSEHNPLLSPVKEHPWEAAAAFNGCPVMIGKKMKMVYRAMSEPDLLKEPHVAKSVVCVAESKDGGTFTNRKVLISPELGNPAGTGPTFDTFGCEDPRVTKLGDTYYIFYTALGGLPFNADNIKVAVALSDDMETIKEKHLVTPFNAKAMALFPNKIGRGKNAKMAALVTVNTDRKPSDICYVEFDTPEDMWSQAFWENWWQNLDSHKLHIRRLADDQVEMGAPPVKTDKGWLVAYSHIQRYGRSDVVFGIEVMLLDLDNPRNIIGRTKGPFMVPDSYYEHQGLVPHIVFPTGALIRDDRYEVYYGAADTHTATASIPLDNLLDSIVDTRKPTFSRYPGNPIIVPRPGCFWEEKGTLNPAAIELGGKIHILYRAVSDRNVSTIGYAVSHDGLSIDERLPKPIYLPRADFEKRGSEQSDFGCEDPRVMVIDSRLYMMYTAYDGVTPRVAVTSISVTDFLARKWSAWAKPEVITPPSIANKDAALLPEAVNGRYMVFHRVHESICADFVDSLDFSREKVTECIEIIDPRRGMWDGGKVGLSTPPIKTPKGWLLFYHGVSWSTTYRVGAVLLDLEDPTVIRARAAIPMFEPEAEYERKGFIPNVVFPCGAVLRGNTVFLYYGAADFTIGVATAKLNALLKMLEV